MSLRSGLRNSTPKYLLSDAELSVTMFNDRSRWFDDVWRFENTVSGGKDYSLNWRFDCSDVRWNSRRWQRLIGDARRFICSVRDRDMGGRGASDTTLAILGFKTRFLAHWMYSEGYQSFAEIGTQAFSEYKDFVVSTLVDQAEDSRTLLTVASYLDVPKRLFLQSSLFKGFPRLKLAADPLQGRTAHSICQELKIQRHGNVLPVPDEVANPTLTEALKWVDEYAADIIAGVRLQDYLFRKVSHWNSKNYAYYIKKGLTGFRFNKCGEADDWRPPLLASLSVRIASEDGDRVVQQTPIEQLSDLFEDLTGACTTVLHSTVGFRSSEGASLKALPISKNGLPHCVDLRPTILGLNEVFYIRGQLKKGRDEVVECEWVAGIRPVGTSHIPPAVRAILVLFELFSHWRKLSGKDDLILSVKSSYGFIRNPKHVKHVLSGSLIKLENKFIMRRVEIPEKYKHWQVNRAQWRKKFSQDIVRSDPEAMPVVGLHFGQMSRHLIESAYFGNDVRLLKLIRDEALVQSAQHMAALVFGEEKFHGKATEILVEHLKVRVASADNRESAVAIISEELANEGLYTWGNSYGDCMFRRENALCHLKANGGEIDRVAIRPNEQERCVDTCKSCTNIIISKRHSPFWLKEFNNLVSSHRLLRDEGEFIIAELTYRRMIFAKSILLTLGYAEKLIDHNVQMVQIC